MTHEPATPSLARTIIQAYYGDQKAQCSGVPYLNHIDMGVAILRMVHPVTSEYNANFLQTVTDAYCLHPIFQMEADGLQHPLITENLIGLNPHAVFWAQEYKITANAYLCKPHYRGPKDQITLSDYHAVNMMLVADKIQNRIDFEKHYLPHAGAKGYERAGALQQYFTNWLTALSVSEEQYQSVAASL